MTVWEKFSDEVRAYWLRKEDEKPETVDAIDMIGESEKLASDMDLDEDEDVVIYDDAVRKYYAYAPDDVVSLLTVSIYEHGAKDAYSHWCNGVDHIAEIEP